MKNEFYAKPWNFGLKVNESLQIVGEIVGETKKPLTL